MTSKYSTAGIGMVYTHVKPTEAERELQARKSARTRSAVEKPRAEPEPASWPPGFVSQIRVNKHGQML
jgi:hypothetical protein